MGGIIQRKKPVALHRAFKFALPTSMIDNYTIITQKATVNIFTVVILIISIGHQKIFCRSKACLGFIINGA